MTEKGCNLKEENMSSTIYPSLENVRTYI